MDPVPFLIATDGTVLAIADKRNTQNSLSSVMSSSEYNVKTRGPWGPKTAHLTLDKGVDGPQGNGYCKYM